ncbi:MAG: DinB family protein [Bacteroidetes bacterium]|nr:DinB family protein [Bacteroidota bacterium]
MVAEIIRQLDFNLAYAKKLVQDINEEQMTIKPGIGLENHPAFTLGHIVTSYANLVNLLTGEFILADGFKEAFQRNGPGDPTLPSEDSNFYPSKTRIIAELEKQHKRLIDALLKMDHKKLQSDLEWRLSSFFPTYLDRIMFVCVNHYAMHLGQLAAWRRAMNFPSALKEMK